MVESTDNAGQVNVRGGDPVVNVVCLKWGTKYPAEYVNRLYRMVSRHLHRPFRFFCMTENDSGLTQGIETLPLQETGLHGWWYKLSLFRRDFYGLQGDLIYLDLDVVIVDEIDFLVDQPGDFLIIRNWSRNAMWNSSVMRFRIGQYAEIWERFLERQDEIMQTLNGDQEWIYACVPEAGNWPSARVLSYKKSLDSKAWRWAEKLGLGRLGLKVPDSLDTPLPPHASIIIFHGKPDPEDVVDGAYGFWKRASFIRDAWR
ncbi:hypothetical protein ADIMK_0915 [Marinobacterium lacunae]|uniref:Glycosyltransferase n=1 Tax=Marinobacterium lacunae TaxID=1232683 RepID=A0A081G358_9GAMM|nr:hypothetical protein [Marinobacterium lacunae]KEA65213.1 hypothetical protein ADIMK_0915 [Marinobacterium lacunae]